MRLSGAKKLRAVHGWDLFDTMIAAYLLDPDVSTISIFWQQSGLKWRYHQSKNSSGKRIPENICGCPFTKLQNMPERLCITWH